MASTEPPAIQVKKNGKLMKRSGMRFDHRDGKWVVPEIYQLDDTDQQDVTFELVYMTPGTKIDGE